MAAPKPGKLLLELKKRTATLDTAALRAQALCQQGVFTAAQALLPTICKPHALPGYLAEPQSAARLACTRNSRLPGTRLGGDVCRACWLACRAA